jgi:hypothetical protein
MGKGTGVVVAQGRVLTADHVVLGAQECDLATGPLIPGIDIVGASQLARVQESDAGHDWALLSVDTADRMPAPISCDGFASGALYFAVGYFNGDDLSVQALRATSMVWTTPPQPDFPFKDEGVRIFDGIATEGQSGSPVFDARGRVTGIIVIAVGKMRSGAVDLRNTSLCRKGASPAT